MPEDLWSAVLLKLDTDGDGMVQIGEFMKQMKNAVADVTVRHFLAYPAYLPILWLVLTRP